MIDAENAERSINQLQEKPGGLLRINAPGSFGAKYLLDVLSQFMHNYPQVKLEVEFNDRFIDVVAEGYDVVIRVGKIKDSNLVARKFTSSYLNLETSIAKPEIERTYLSISFIVTRFVTEY